MVACVTDRHLISTGSRSFAEPRILSFVPDETAVPLRTALGRGGPSLWIQHVFVVTLLGDRRAYEARTVGYRYHVLDTHGREFLAYHWHPIGRSPVTTPHAHVSGSYGPIEIVLGVPVSLSDAHLPTGPVALADVVRLLIAELGVAPRRPDWDAVLRRNRDLPAADDPTPP